MLGSGTSITGPNNIIGFRESQPAGLSLSGTLRMTPVVVPDRQRARPDAASAPLALRHREAETTTGPDAGGRFPQVPGRRPPRFGRAGLGGRRPRVTDRYAELHAETTRLRGYPEFEWDLASLARSDRATGAGPRPSGDAHPSARRAPSSACGQSCSSTSITLRLRSVTAT